MARWLHCCGPEVKQDILVEGDGGKAADLLAARKQKRRTEPKKKG